MNESKIYKGVKLGKNVSIAPFCLIGFPPGDSAEGELETIIGDNSVIRSHTVIYAGSIIGENFCTGHHAVIREFNQIGKNVSIGSLSCLEHHLRIRDGVRIHSQVFVPEYTVLEEECWIGPNVVFTNAPYPRSTGVKESLKGAHIESKALIGANTTLLPGISVGRGALIGAGSVVTKDVKSETVVAGNPAAFIKSIRSISEYKEWLSEYSSNES